MKTRKLTTVEIEAILNRESFFSDQKRLLRPALEKAKIPIIPDLEQRIWEGVRDTSDSLNMRNWHHHKVHYARLDDKPKIGKSCGTTHCRAGWAVQVAGITGYRLEHTFNHDVWHGIGTEVVGAAIYLVNAGYIPNFFHYDDIEVREDIKRKAANYRRRQGAKNAD